MSIFYVFPIKGVPRTIIILIKEEVSKKRGILQIFMMHIIPVMHTINKGTYLEIKFIMGPSDKGMKVGEVGHITRLGGTYFDYTVTLLCRDGKVV